jgi:hypothetical protein
MFYMHEKMCPMTCPRVIKPAFPYKLVIKHCGKAELRHRVYS